MTGAAALSDPRQVIFGKLAMKYVVTDDFVAAHGWTPDKTAKLHSLSLTSQPI